MGVLMKYNSPIYNLLHQEIKACASYLLSKKFTPEHAISKLYELHQFASRVHDDARYIPLFALKKYLETTMLCYQDEENKLQSIRLSEVVSLLGVPSEIKFKPSIVQSINDFFLDHFLKESKPGRPLFRKLTELKKI